jgi:hypothetical protein
MEGYRASGETGRAQLATDIVWSLREIKLRGRDGRA